MILVGVLGRVFCLCPVFLAVLVCDDLMLNYLDVVEAWED